MNTGIDPPPFDLGIDNINEDATEPQQGGSKCMDIVVGKELSNNIL